MQPILSRILNILSLFTRSNAWIVRSVKAMYNGCLCFRHFSCIFRRINRGTPRPEPQRDSNISFKQVSVVYLGPYGQNLVVVQQEDSSVAIASVLLILIEHDYIAISHILWDRFLLPARTEYTNHVVKYSTLAQLMEGHHVLVSFSWVNCQLVFSASQQSAMRRLPLWPKEKLLCLVQFRVPSLHLFFCVLDNFAGHRVQRFFLHLVGPMTFFIPSYITQLSPVSNGNCMLSHSLSQ